MLAYENMEYDWLTGDSIEVA
ncbi:MAG: hypothetical protein K0S68_476, partial [Candidatus Saccharibacteria bacterium]|nr:hypothetical protein [Candidatus Saccharibacteria bacterium]